MTRTTKEVDDVEKTLVQGTSDLRWAEYAVAELSAPNGAGQGTAVPCAGTSSVVRGGSAPVVSRICGRDIFLVQVAVPVEPAFHVELVDGARSTDLPGLHPRAAPV